MTGEGVEDFAVDSFVVDSKVEVSGFSIKLISSDDIVVVSVSIVSKLTGAEVLMLFKMSFLFGRRFRGTEFLLNDDGLVILLKLFLLLMLY